MNTTKSAQASMKNVRIPPRKARLTADLIRGRLFVEAQAQLLYAKSKGARLFAKLLNSAAANAETRLDVDRSVLRIASSWVDPGATLKRSKGKCRGGTVPIMKRTSHLHVVVEEKK